MDVPKPAAETLQDMIQGKKVLVNVSSLLAMAHHKCHRSDCHEVIIRCTPIVSGCSMKLEIMCSANHLMEWHSCPNIMNKEGGSIPANNILQAAGILFSGNHFAKFFMFNRILNIHGISESTFYRYQKHFLVPVVDQYWLHQQADMISQLAGKLVILAGDGRCNSPGSSAKYCSYTLMDTETDLVVHTATVDKREVGGKSPNMEREALFRGLRKVIQDISVKEIVTDASASVRKMLGITIKCLILYGIICYQ